MAESVVDAEPVTEESAAKASESTASAVDVAAASTVSEAEPPQDAAESVAAQSTVTSTASEAGDMNGAVNELRRFTSDPLRTSRPAPLALVQLATLLREPGPVYNVRYDKVPLEKVAGADRSFPDKWITPSGTDVTDEFVRYARPLIGDDWPSLPLFDGRLRLARLQPIFAGQKLPTYVPQADCK